MVARRCFATKFSQNFDKIYREITVLQSLSNTAKDLRAIMLATLLNRDHRNGVSEPVVCRVSIK